ncbi:MAG: YggS family pyridoxal phosphate-dependent enzyme [Flavobacteriales bacterium]|nr:YggS family pyridoxal phosphate-dependent enzyme [Flavobacteriales bacterium]
MTQDHIATQLTTINNELKPFGASLIAVSKTHPPEVIREAYDAGQRIFGENKVQELQTKQPVLPPDIQWHLIGHLQTNKVKYIAPFVAMIHAVDSLKLLAEINKQAAKNNRVIPCLLQFHIATEESKFGLNIDEARQLLESEEYKAMNHIAIHGVMGMATFTDNQDKVRSEFRNLKGIFDSLREKYFADQLSFKEISMGMSGDYQIALEEGSTMVRVGSMIFGSRSYQV